jgi:hypothetical protein
MEVANTLDYYDTTIFTAVKRFTVQAPAVEHYSGGTRICNACKSAIDGHSSLVVRSVSNTGKTFNSKL